MFDQYGDRRLDYCEQESMTSWTDRYQIISRGIKVTLVLFSKNSRRSVPLLESDIIVLQE
jgi:hypothetical protein